MALQRDDLLPGDCMSMDQYESQHLGRLPHTFGKEKNKDKVVGGTIDVNHATGLIFAEQQAYLRARNTLKSKIAFK
jgi:hypothetical protein